MIVESQLSRRPEEQLAAAIEHVDEGDVRTG